MDEFIKLLDPGLDYIEHELLDDTIIIRVASNRFHIFYQLPDNRKFPH